MKGRSRFVVGAIVMTASFGSARAQQILLDQKSATIGDSGGACAVVGDWDGDGIDDLAIPSPWSDVNGTDSGSLFVHAGGTGALLFRVDGPAGDAGFGGGGVLGDLDGDGIVDFIANSWNATQATIHLLSGADGHEIGSIVGPRSTGFEGGGPSIDDLDGDGVRDLLVYIDDPNSAHPLAGEVDVVSPVTGAVLRSHVGTYDFERLGFFACQLGDLDGDGVHEYAIVAKHARQLGPPVFFIYSGATGARLARISKAGAAQAGFNPWLENLGDVNGDGVEDFAIPGYWSDAQVDPLKSGALYFFSGRTLLELGWSLIDDYILDSFGAAGDFNGDGLGDVVLGTDDLVWTGRARILVPSGLTGHTAAFRAFANDANGRVISSFVREIAFN